MLFALWGTERTQGFLSNVTCNVEYIFYYQNVSLRQPPRKAEPLKYVFYANDSILVTKLHVRVPSYPKGGGKLYRRLKFSNCATKECDESNSCKRFRCLRPNPQRDEIKDSSRLRSKRAIFHWCPPQCVRSSAPLVSIARACCR